MKGTIIFCKNVKNRDTAVINVLCYNLYHHKNKQLNQQGKHNGLQALCRAKMKDKNNKNDYDTITQWRDV